ATVGLAVFQLRGGQALTFGRGEFLVLGCAVAFAGHILLTERFARDVDPVRFAAAQCALTALAATGWAFAIELRHGWPPAPSARLCWSAAFCAVAATTVSFLVQTVAQRRTPATHVALIFASEPVFAALASWLWFGETIGPAMLAGGALILAGMVCAELGPHLRLGRRVPADQRASASRPGPPVNEASSAAAGGRGTARWTMRRRRPNR
ncbi:MAG TPA: DMT family transporter, partial [Planctomycetota bacterium]|nr:DMT family transporter [Planctomycetota bacterium]